MATKVGQRKGTERIQQNSNIRCCAEVINFPDHNNRGRLKTPFLNSCRDGMKATNFFFLTMEFFSRIWWLSALASKKSVHKSCCVIEPWAMFFKGQTTLCSLKGFESPPDNASKAATLLPEARQCVSRSGSQHTSRHWIGYSIGNWKDADINFTKIFWGLKLQLLSTRDFWFYCQTRLRRSLYLEFGKFRFKNFISG